ncbi:hypothetical protein B0H67DRAFT_560480 [Lasiosphaeris hirsuta]|uniref:Uncharacterized protein n=1 Tax=Lasiosphaeris hirsuta TaxID=260670 RepID=A0AA40B995_9PEZI|nr:hypothetical protein B0H67DRAFT_560480 [Lasiosphaeris hirsuta]
MGSKRDNTSLDDLSTQPSNKRRREQAPSKSRHSEPKTDATYGQRAVFPSLDDPTHPSDEDLEFEDEADAIAYLRSVRQEANSIPNLLVAPKAGPQLPPHLSEADDRIDRSIYDNGVGDARGYYHDGAYTAAPDTESSDEGECHESDVDWNSERDQAAAEKALHDAYYHSLITKFKALRSQLCQKPPQELIQALDKDHGTEVGHFGAKSRTFSVWEHRLRYTDPLPVQISTMERRNALKVLRVLLGGKFIRHGYELRERTSRWIWALLARVPDRGELDYTDVGWIRELGKRAVLMMVSITQMAALQQEVDGELEGGEALEEGEVEDGHDFLEELEAGEEGEISEDPLPEDVDDDAMGVLPPPAAVPALPLPNDPTVEDEEGEVDMDIDDGEVSDESASRDIQADIAAAKARLLSQLENPKIDDKPPINAMGEGRVADNEHDEQTTFDEKRSRINVRATLNMILTVAGEFYGQRDLLEFRDPFPSL